MKMRFLLFFTLFLISNEQKIEIEVSHNFNSIEENSDNYGVDFDKCFEDNYFLYTECGKKKLIQSLIRNCVRCGLSMRCGWCSDSKKCIPLDPNIKKISVCKDCQEMVPIDKCYILRNNPIEPNGESLINNYKRPQFTPTDYEEGFHYGINNSIFKIKAEEYRLKLNK